MIENSVQAVESEMGRKSVQENVQPAQIAICVLKSWPTDLIAV